ncbi:RDD family protein [Granulicella sp. S156]|uniref:RDD family protein n=1 Tax=Granulicella sp. S156 TaxID=1747224 RepID=UPI00131A9B07|nr:RDD family protein [Granulicella sp. S156]
MTDLTPFPAGDPSVRIDTPQPGQIGALWHRLIAFFIDAIILFVTGTAIALPLSSTFSRLGLWGRLIGFCIALFYLATLNSELGGGQTGGKQLMRLRVVDSQGRTISFGKSLVRYSILAIPVFLNRLPVPISRAPGIITFFLSVVIFGIGGATLYLVLFNGNTRQGLHDLAVGSYVVEADISGPVRVRPIWKPHWVILALPLLVSGIFAMVTYNWLEQNGSFPEIMQDIRLVEGVDGVEASSVMTGTQHFASSDEIKTIFTVNVVWRGPCHEERSHAGHIAELLLQRDPRIEEYDLLQIGVTCGYDLGIASHQISRNVTLSPSEWQTYLDNPITSDDDAALGNP